MDNMSFTTQLLIVLLGFMAVIGLLMLILSYNPDSDDTTRLVPDELIIIEGAGRAKVITIDGVEYILVTTYRGIGICKK